MAWTHDGTEQFGNATGYRIRNTETGESLVLPNPMLAQQAAGPLNIPSPGAPPPMAGAPSPASVAAPPDPRKANVQAYLGPDIGKPGPMPDRREANAADAMAGAAPPPKQRVVTDALSAPAPPPPPEEFAAAEAAKANPPEEPDDPGLVFMDGDVGGGQQPQAPGTPQAPQPYQPKLPHRRDDLPEIPQYKTVASRAAGFRDQGRKLKGDPETVEDLRVTAKNLLDQQLTTARREEEIKGQMLHNARQEGELLRARNIEEQATQKREYDKAEEWRVRRVTELDNEARDLAEKKVDPNRWYKSAGPGGVILAAIAQSLGTFGKTQDPARIIDSFIQSDIAEQEEEWRSSRDKLDVKRNAFAREMEAGMNPEIAKKKIEALQNTYAASVLEDRQIVQTLNLLGVDSEKLRQHFAEKNLGLRAEIEKSFGEERDQKYLEAIRGGRRGLTFDEQIKYRNQLADLSQKENLAYGDQDPDAVRIKAMEQQQDSGGLGPSGFRPGSEKSEAEVTKVMQSVADKRGITMSRLYLQSKRLQDTLARLNQKYGDDLPGRGLMEDWLQPLAGERAADARLLKREFNELVNMSARDESGAVLGLGEEERKKLQIAAEDPERAASDEEVIRTAEDAIERIHTGYNGIMAGHRPEAVEEYERRFEERERKNRVNVSTSGSSFEPLE